MQFDIEEFYPTISNELLQKAINYASTFGNEEINVIMRSRKSLPFDSRNIWIKKGYDPNFDVTMGSSDGAEICELPSLCILHSGLRRKMQER